MQLLHNNVQLFHLKGVNTSNRRLDFNQGAAFFWQFTSSLIVLLDGSAVWELFWWKIKWYLQLVEKYLENNFWKCSQFTNKDQQVHVKVQKKRPLDGAPLLSGWIFHFEM